MAISLDNETSVSSKKASKVESVEKIKVKFNAGTLLILNRELFNSALTEEEQKKRAFSVYPEGGTYKHIRFGQELELTKEEFAKIKEQFADPLNKNEVRKVKISNTRMGDLNKVFKERLAMATEKEKEFIKENEEEFKYALFERPIFEIVH